MPNKKQKITLRAVRPEDRSLLYAIYASTREEEMALTGWDKDAQDRFLEMQFNAFQLTYPVTKEELQNTHIDPTGRIRYEDQVIELDGTPVGRLVLWRTNDEIRGADIALLTAYRSKGIGSHILRQMIEESNRKNKPIRIHVLKMNRAKELYERFGFELTGEHGFHFQMERPVGPIDEELAKKKIPTSEQAPQ